MTYAYSLETIKVMMGAEEYYRTSKKTLNLLKEISTFFQITNTHSYNIQLH